MPRIEAPTVAEHHLMRRAEIVAAARYVLGQEGAAGVTPTAVARRAGLARSSLYQYYPSTAALLTAAVEAMFRDAEDQIDRALRETTDPWERIRAYIRVAITLATDRCGPFQGLQPTELPVSHRRRLGELHEGLAAPLRQSVADLGIPAPDRLCRLVLGTVSSAAGLVQRGEDVEVVIIEAQRFARAGLAAAGTE